MFFKPAMFKTYHLKLIEELFKQIRLKRYCEIDNNTIETIMACLKNGYELKANKASRDFYDEYGFVRKVYLDL